jgi:MFS family permease
MHGMALSTFTPRERKKNLAGFFIDYVFFGIGLTFAGTATTLPAFASRLTDNPILIGLVGVLWSGGWTLPQIFAANYLSPMKRKMPLMLLLCWVSRPVFAVFALFVFLSRASPPGLTLGLLYLTAFLFVFVDSIVGVAWFDMLGKALQPRERGRLLGVGQTASGLLSVGAGFVIQAVLASVLLPFPFNYAVIFLLADAAFLISLGGLHLIKEPIEPVAEKRVPMANYFPQLVHLLRTDKPFLRVNIARLLVAFTAIASPFLAVYGIRNLGLPEETVGVFAIAQTFGSALAGLLLGWLADRSGAHTVIRIVGGLYLLVPICAFGASLVTGMAAAQTVILAGSFFFMGMGDGGIMLGFLNYVLEIAPAEQRPVYIGLTNTIIGIIILYPFLGGWIAGMAGYQTVFVVVMIGIMAGWLVSWTLPHSSGSRSVGAGGRKAELPSTAV